MREKWTFRWTLSCPTQDPFLLVEFENAASALCFDCGMRIWGNVRTVLKLQHLFITHAHIDHLIGFDHIIRALLGEDKTLHIYGPEGIAGKLVSKLQGYDWDRSAEQELILKITETRADCTVTSTHACNNRFALDNDPVVGSLEGPLVDDKLYQVWAVPVDHGGSPCNAYVLKEKDHSRIDKDNLTGLGLQPGPWVGKLLASTDNTAEETFTMDNGDQYSLNELREKLVRIQRGKTLVYVTDTVFRRSWVESLKSIATGADILACESTFLDEDEHLAETYHHMTSVQAARLANEINASRLMLFHISSRYHPKLYRAVQEARRSFPATDMVHMKTRRKR